MIVKAHTPLPTHDRLRRAGDAAERQMAFYLRRAFGEDPQVHVFNHLRLEHGGEAAQLDHLVFHRAGLIVVESKSVTGTVSINDRQEWTRQWNGRWSGMPSPVLQARRQAELLRALLQAHKAELRGKVFFGLKQGGFGNFIIDVVVAISDRGVIDHPGELPEIRKADQVPDLIKAQMARHRRAVSLLSLETRKGEAGFTLSPEEFARVSVFLQRQHRERPAQAPPTVPPVPAKPPAIPEAAPAPRPQCGKCGGEDVEIRYRYNHYLHCRGCQANSPLRLTCPDCGARATIRKQGKQHYGECPACGRSGLYFVNP